MEQALLTGNEAVARGAYEGGVWVATGYPGTPSSEIIEVIGRDYTDIRSEWSVNEKVALEIAIGSSIAGVRSLCTMKHVGLNVAADPLMTVTYTGVNAGLVILVADDPGMHSSQNEQDTRNYGNFGKLPVLEPSNSQEAKDFLIKGLEISEKLDTPVILRSVTRISHTRTPVEIKKTKRSVPAWNYKKDMSKYVMVPANAIKRHPVVVKRWEKLGEYSESFEGHKVHMDSRSIGIITHGLIYNYVREALPAASVFNVGMYPIPLEQIKAFSKKVKKLYVVEELDPVIENELKAAGIKCTGKKIIPLCGELSVDIIRQAFRKGSKIPLEPVPVPGRPPVLCKGCGHIPVFEVLNTMKYTVLGDIGCYTLGALAPYSAMDTTICMGASIGNEIGFKKAAEITGHKLNSVAVIGDSTFFHSGMTNLLNAVYNNTPAVVLILDNRITAMTGHQPNPKTGLSNSFDKVTAVDLETVVKGLGVKRVRRVNAYKKDEVKKAIEEESASGELSVILVDELCVIAETRLKKLAMLNS